MQLIFGITYAIENCNEVHALYLLRHTESITSDNIPIRSTSMKCNSHSQYEFYRYNSKDNQEPMP